MLCSIRRWGSLLIYCRLHRRRYYGDAGVNHARSLSTSRIYHSPDETVINYRDCPIGMRTAKRSTSPYLRFIRIINLAINSMIFLNDCLRQTYFCQRKNVRWQRLNRHFLIALWWFSSFNVLSRSFTLTYYLFIGFQALYIILVNYSHNFKRHTSYKL